MNIFPATLKSYWPLAPAALLLGIGCWLVSGSGGTLPFTSEILHQENRRLEKLCKEIMELREQNRRLAVESRPLELICSGMVFGENEVAAEHLREGVEKIAAAAGTTISSLREVQFIPVTDSWNLCTLSFSAESSIAGLQEFLTGIEGHAPRFYWRRLTLRPDNVTAPSRIMLDGQLAILNQPGERE